MRIKRTPALVGGLAVGAVATAALAMPSLASDNTTSVDDTGDSGLSAVALADVGQSEAEPAAADALSPLRPTRIDLGDLVERTVAAHLGSTAAAGIDLKAVTKPDVIATVDGGHIRQILTNLIVNALRHTSVEGVVLVTLFVDEALTIEVSDSGEGIAAEHLAQVFDRFHRTDQSRARSTGGSGLGLAIARELAHDGRLEVESVIGQGSTFRLVLPRHETRAGAQCRAPQTPRR